MPRRDKFQLVEGDMRVVEIQRRNSTGIGREIAHDVAAARGDGDDVIARPDRQSFHVHDRIFPDLRIHQSLKSGGEEPFAQSRFRDGPVAMHGFIQSCDRGAFCACSDINQWRFSRGRTGNLWLLARFRDAWMTIWGDAPAIAKA